MSCCAKLELRVHGMSFSTPDRECAAWGSMWRTSGPASIAAPQVLPIAVAQESNCGSQPFAMKSGVPDTPGTFISSDSRHHSISLPPRSQAAARFRLCVSEHRRADDPIRVAQCGAIE